MPEPAHGAASAEAAWQNGIAAAQIGEFGQALRWLERAVRLAPGDPRIALDLANIRLQAAGSAADRSPANRGPANRGPADGPGQIAKAADEFERLAARHDVAAGWLGLLAARRLQGEHRSAAAALQALLSRHCVPQDPGFAAVASAVAQAAGWPGWCGIDAGGLLHIAAAGAVAGLADGAKVALAHAAPAPAAEVITVHSGGAALLGSPLHPARLQHCEGVVETAGAALTGWASRPAAPWAMPRLFLLDAAGRRRKIGIADALPADADAPLTPRFAFRCPVSLLQGLQPPLRVVGPGDRDIFGSPVDGHAELAAPAIPAAYRGPANAKLPSRAGLRIVVPVYRGLTVTQACLNAALQALPAGAGLIVVDDASPEPGLPAWLDAFCAQPRVVLIRHEANLGFPAAANAGLAAAAGCDVLLLNSDTLLPPLAVATLLAALYSRPDIGSATPFSNEATICSYPDRAGGNAAPDLAGAIACNALAAQVNADQAVEIPTGVGFCLAMRHDCIARTGLLRPALFAQGYGEEVDWCLRARHRGYRHVAATGAYVAHVSRISFGAAGRALNARNARLLRRLYPGYEQLIDAHATADPLAPARRRLDAARFSAAGRPEAVLLISHNHGGGVQRRIAAEMRDIRAAGGRPILLCPVLPEDPKAARYPLPAALTDDAPGDYPNLRFVLREEEAELLGLLRAERIGHAVLHHGLGHHPALRIIAEKLGCRQDIVIHDYASFCPRVHLIGPHRQYCGEPDLQGCTACVAAAGDETREGLGPRKLLARSAKEFAAARRVIAPSPDAARRIARHFPNLTPVVTPWEDDAVPVTLRPPGGTAPGGPAPGGPARRIAVLGGIGPAKGYDVLLACAQDAARRDLPLEFVIAGGSVDDETLLATGRMFITGAYAAGQLPELLAGLQADLAFIPSIWPETWCFTLSEAWAAGLYTLAFDLGAQAGRIAATKRGGLLPLGLPAARVNDALLAWQPAFNL